MSSGSSRASGNEKIGVGGAVPSADAAAHLIEVGKSEGVGAIDEDRVGIGDVDAIFDDGGRDEDVGLAAFKGVEDGVELIGGHLAMACDDARFGEQFLDLFGDAKDRFDAVVDEIGLAIAGEFAQERIFDELQHRVRR